MQQSWFYGQYLVKLRYIFMKKSFKHFKRHLPSVSSFEKDFFISCSERNIDACMYCNCKIVNMHTYIFNAHKATIFMHATFGQK